MVSTKVAKQTTMSYETSPSQENRSSHHPLPLVPTKVANEQEMALTLDTALKALEASQNEVGFLNKELSCAIQQAELDFRRLEDFRNVYDDAFGASADTNSRLRDDISSLQEKSEKQKASHDKVSKELRRLKDRNNTLQQRNNSLQKRNGSLQEQNGFLREENRRLGQLRDGVRPSSPVTDEPEQFNNEATQRDAANAVNYAQYEEQESKVATTVAETEDVPSSDFFRAISEAYRKLRSTEEYKRLSGEERMEQDRPMFEAKVAELKRRNRAREQARLENEAGPNAGKNKRRHPSPETASQQKPAKRRTVTTVAETEALPLESLPWASLHGSNPSPRKYLPLPEQVVGFWRPRPDSTQDSPAVPEDRTKAASEPQGSKTAPQADTLPASVSMDQATIATQEAKASTTLPSKQEKAKVPQQKPVPSWVEKMIAGRERDSKM